MTHGLSDGTAEISAPENGWRLSRYNLFCPLPESDCTIIANLYRGTLTVANELEMYLLSVYERLDVNHPIITRFARRGILVDFDELAALDAAACPGAQHFDTVSLTICPTLACNFDCPYCFEHHRSSGVMQEDVMLDTVKLAERMIQSAGADTLSITWYGGEPLLAPQVIRQLSRMLIDLTEAMGIHYDASIITNGYLLDEANVRLLEEARVTSAEITLDGIGRTHDASRRLKNGNATFDVIAGNLSRPHLPFSVTIRQNIHEGNRGSHQELCDFVERLARRSGNSLTVLPALVHQNFSPSPAVPAGDEKPNAALAARYDAVFFTKARTNYCGADLLSSICVDPKGNLFKCWETADKQEYRFAGARTFDPSRFKETSDQPEMLMRFIDHAVLRFDPECRGCPAYRDKPELYVTAVYDYLRSQKSKPGENHANT